MSACKLAVSKEKDAQTSFFPEVLVSFGMQGRIQYFQIEGGGGGGGRLLCKQSPLRLESRAAGPLAGPGSFTVSDALSCHLSLIFKHSDTNLEEKKNTLSIKFYWGARLLRPVCTPPGSDTEMHVFEVLYIDLLIGWLND